MPQISVIIPVYKVEEYIEKCIISILKQTYKDFEIILINDKSPDNSIKIAEKVLKVQSEISFKIIHCERNGGISVVRNIGISNAQGKFILFLDSDDWIEEQMFSKLIESAEQQNSEMVFCRVRQIYPNSSNYDILNSLKPGNYSGREALIYLFKGKYNAHMWKILIATSLFNGITFPEGKIYEDAIILPYVIYKAKTVTFINDILYNYLQRTGSITKSYDPRLQEVAQQLKDMEMDFSKLLSDREMLHFKKYIYLIYHVVACHASYFSTEYNRSKPTLINCGNNVEFVSIIKILLDKPSRTILELAMLKIAPERFFKKYSINN